MIVTEEMLAPYRTEGGPVRIGSLTGAISPSLSATQATPRSQRVLAVDHPVRFTPTTDAFQSDLANRQSSTLRDKPAIVLVLAFVQTVPVLSSGHEWLALDHQYGGHACAHESMIAIRLIPRPSVLPALQLIAQDGFYAESGHFDRSQVLASRIASYVAALARISVDCEATWRYLAESLYPIDATQDNLHRIAEDAPDLETIADWKGFVRARYSDDPVIFVMTENSD